VPFATGDYQFASHAPGQLPRYREAQAHSFRGASEIIVKLHERLEDYFCPIGSDPDPRVPNIDGSTIFERSTLNLDLAT
jgi:hypothetical protein